MRRAIYNYSFYLSLLFLAFNLFIANAGAQSSDCGGHWVTSFDPDTGIALSRRYVADCCPCASVDRQVQQRTVVVVEQPYEEPVYRSQSEREVYNDYNVGWDPYYGPYGSYSRSTMKRKVHVWTNAPEWEPQGEYRNNDRYKDRYYDRNYRDREYRDLYDSQRYNRHRRYYR